MAKHICFLNLRTATTWLACQLRANVTDPKFTVTHDAWVQVKRAATLKTWAEAGLDDVMVALTGIWMPPIPVIQKEFNPQWVFLWRRPIPWMLSYMALWARMKRAEKPIREEGQRLGYGLRRVGRNLIAQAEAVLCLLESYGVTVQHWHMDDYTTDEGFRNMCESLGLPVRDQLVGMDKRRGTSWPSLKLNPEGISGRLREELLAYWNALPHVQEGYNQALSRLATRVETDPRSLLRDFWDTQHEKESRVWLTCTPPKVMLQQHGLVAPEGQTVLDIGVGDGSFSRFCAEKGNRIIACDISSLALDRLSDVAKVRCSPGGLGSAPVADLAVCHLVFQHCTDKEVAHILRTVRLKPDGLFSFQFASLVNGTSDAVKKLVDQGLLVFRSLRRMIALVTGSRNLEIVSISEPTVHRWNDTDVTWRFVKCRAAVHGGESSSSGS